MDGHWICLFCSASNSPLRSDCSLCEVPKGHRDMTTVPNTSMECQTYGAEAFTFENPSDGPLYSSNDVHRFSPNKSTYGVQENEWRILLIGKTGVGKSATGNNILGGKTFQSKMSGKSVTKKSQIGRADRFGKKLLLVDTPGIFDTGKTNDEVITEIVKCIGITSPGLHAIILVVHIGRFTEEEKKTVDLFLNHLGQQLIQFLVVVFTRKDDLDRENTTIDEYVDSLEPSSLLAEIIQKSRCRYIAFDNTAVGQQNDDQVKRLFSVIENLIRENGGTFYTNDMYREAEMAMRRRMDEERRRLEEEKRQAIERIEAPFRAKIEKERRERESLSHDLALTKMQTASLTHDKSRIEEELEKAKRRSEREAAERENDKRRMEEERRIDQEINESRMREIREESQRREDERRREYDQRMEEELEMTKRRSEREAAERENERRRMEVERRRDQETNERRMREIREESQRREDERRKEYDQRQRQMEDDRRRDKEELKKQRKEIKRLEAKYDERMRDQNIREAARDDVEKENPGILKTIIEAVSEVPVIGPAVKAIGKFFKLI